MESTSFTPSLAQDLRENARVCLMILVVVPVIVYFMRRGISLQYAVISGIGGAVLMFIVYTCRFLFFAPKRVECSDSWLKLEFRNGKSAEIAWAEVNGASFASIYGLRWKFRTLSSTLRLRGDGFTGMEWFRISRLILEKLAARQIELSTDTAGRNFLS
jgi:hypothetical protein